MTEKPENREAEELLAEFEAYRHLPNGYVAAGARAYEEVRTQLLELVRKGLEAEKADKADVLCRHEGPRFCCSLSEGHIGNHKAYVGHRLKDKDFLEEWPQPTSGDTAKEPVDFSIEKYRPALEALGEDSATGATEPSPHTCPDCSGKLVICKGFHGSSDDDTLWLRCDGCKKQWHQFTATELPGAEELLREIVAILGKSPARDFAAFDAITNFELSDWLKETRAALAALFGERRSNVKG